MNRHPWRRLAAAFIDWLVILGWVAVTAAVGVPLFLSGATRGLPVVALNIVSALVLVVPVTLGMAALESSAREASVGKRALRLIVVTAAAAERVSLQRALLRNALKIALPWTIAHLAVYAIVQASETGSVPPRVWIITVIAYVLPIAYVVSLFIGSGRPPYDRLSGSVVIGRPA